MIEYNVYALGVAEEATPIAITSGGSEEGVVYGIPDWVYEGEGWGGAGGSFNLFSFLQRRSSVMTTPSGGHLTVGSCCSLGLMTQQLSPTPIPYMATWTSSMTP